jgi:hypothetical protein
MNLIPKWWWGGTNNNTTQTKEPTSMEVINEVDSSKDALEARTIQLKKKSRDLLKEAQNEKDKNKQLQLMKRRQIYENQIKQLEGQIINLEQTSNVVMSASIAQNVVGAMKHSSVAIKDITNKISVSDIDDVTDDLNEHLLDVNEIQNALGKPLGATYEQDQDSILAEIASWSEQDEFEKAQRVEQDMPSVSHLRQKVTVNNNNNNNHGGGSEAILNE